MQAHKRNGDLQHGEFLRSDGFKLLKTGKTGGVISAAVLPCWHTVNTSNQATVIKLFQTD